MTGTCRLEILEWAHGNLAVHVHNPPHSSKPPKRGWMTTCAKYSWMRYLYELWKLSWKWLRPQFGSTNHPICMFDKFHLTSNFKSKVPSDVFKNKNECQSTSTFSFNMSLQCHMPSSMCHFKILKCQLTYDFFLDKSHYMSKLKLCVSIDVHLILYKFLSVKCQNLQKLCQTYTL